MLSLLCSLSLISTNFDVKSIIFPKFGQGLLTKIAKTLKNHGRFLSTKCVISVKRSAYLNGQVIFRKRFNDIFIPIIILQSTYGNLHALFLQLSLISI